MRAKIFFTFLFITIFSSSFFAKSVNPDPWGFFGHKMINRLAVFTLPPEMIGFYKQNIEFLTEHAVDPDKRRYASKHEAPRHYMDLDRYGKAPYDNVLPKEWTDALAKFTDIYVVTKQNDTIQLFDYQKTRLENKEIIFQGKKFKKLTQQDSLTLKFAFYKNFFIKNIYKNLYEDEMLIDLDSLRKIFPLQGTFVSAFAKENLSQHGIVPYHLASMQHRLMDAFIKKDVNKILRMSAEFGHYIGDAHVPLHTTENYNGQLTNQHGIHGFWESRIPELFSSDYDFWVGAAKYIDDPKTAYWDIVLDSHKLVEDVLKIEKNLSQTFPSDQITCLEERMGATVKTQCEAYAKAFSDKLQGQVEDRMRDAILAVGNAWLTAWTDAGQPDLNAMMQAQIETATKDDEQIDKASQSGKAMIGRSEN